MKTYYELIYKNIEDKLEEISKVKNVNVNVLKMNYISRLNNLTRIIRPEDLENNYSKVMTRAYLGVKKQYGAIK